MKNNSVGSLILRIGLIGCLCLAGAAGCGDSAAGNAVGAASTRAGTPIKKVFPNGLITEDTEIGNGREAKKGDHVSVRYVGTLLDGTEFDSSDKVGRPFEFQIGKGRVIKGWDLGIPGMKVGGHRNLTIPSDLAYGTKGAGGGLIPANATLKFQIDLLDVSDAPASAGAPGHEGHAH
jgi:FKBP-type peptidyl-prolyl cis-trans isomerase